MASETQVKYAEALRQMQDRRHILLLPNAWDAGSARLLATHVLRAIATTSGGVAWALGYGDGEQAPFDEILAVVRCIIRVVDQPVTVDFESGYGATPVEVATSIHAVIATGTAGINLEDGMPGHGPLRDIDDAAGRIHAAREAASADGVPLVINARVDNWMSPTDDPAAPLAELAKLGVARVSTATWFSALALGAVDQAARAILATGTFDALATNFNYMDAQKLFTAG